LPLADAIKIQPDLYKNTLEELNSSATRWGLECQKFVINEIDIDETYKNVVDTELQLEVFKKAEKEKVDEIAKVYSEELKKLFVVKYESETEELHHRAKNIADKLKILSAEYEKQPAVKVAAEVLLKDAYFQAKKKLVQQNKMSLTAELQEPDKMFEGSGKDKYH